MADELQKINQPDNVPIPSGVSTGYQQQNVIAEAMRNGFDGSAPVSDTATTIKIPVGGPVDVNGVLFSLASIATLTIPLADTDYYIYLAAGSTTDFLTPTLTTNAGTFDASKNARYTGGGDRILNWVVRRNGSASYVYKMLDVQNVTYLTDQGLRTIDNVTHKNGVFTGTLDALTINTGYGDFEIGQNLRTFDDVQFYKGTFDNVVSVGNNLTIAASIFPSPIVTSGSWSSSFTLSRGVYNVSLGSGSTIQALISGTWRTIATGPSQGSTVFAGTSNVRYVHSATSYRQTY